MKLNTRKLCLTERLGAVMKTLPRKEFEETWVRADKFIKGTKKYLNQRRGIERAKLFHGMIDHVLPRDTEKSKDKISCGKGCSNCCHVLVVVFKMEADLIVEYCRENGISPNFDLLRKQEGHDGSDPSGYLRIPHEDRKCAFLDSEGCCSIYPVRPARCRTYLCVGDPEKCDTSDGVGGMNDFMIPFEASLVESAMLSMAKPKLLADAILQAYRELEGK